MIDLCVCRDTAGQERFRTITTAYYRGAMVRHAPLRLDGPCVSQTACCPLLSSVWCHFLSVAGHHAGVWHHQREVVWQHQELDTQHWGGKLRPSHDFSDQLLKLKHQRMQVINIWMWLIDGQWPGPCLCCQHASSDVERMVLGNKCDMNDKRQVSKERGEKVRDSIDQWSETLI